MPLREIDPAAIDGPEAFREIVAMPCTPAVMRGVCADWPAVRAFAASREEGVRYLAGFETGRRAEGFVGSPEIEGRYYYGENLEGFNFDRRQVSLTEALEQIVAFAEAPEDGSFYLGSLRAQQFAPDFGAANRLPFLSADVEPRIWIGNASHVSCHYDTFDNLACAVAGRRTFTLFPPDAIGDLYVGPIDRTMAGPPVGLAVGSEPGDPRYPRFENARGRALEVVLEPGDVLYLPKLWWHQVEAADRVNVLVNFWWDAFAQKNDEPMTALMLAMITIAERPEAERAAWRAFFDHYVFRPEGHPLAHLPPEQHGVLGPLAAGNYGRIRAMVMQALRGG